MNSITDITQQFQLCRETARHIWNSCFVHSADDPSAGTILESFDRICEALFESLVLSRFSIEDSAVQLNVQGFTSIRVVPAIAAGTPILVNRTSPSGPYWDDPMHLIIPADVQLGFIGFFDWDSSGTIDMRYLRVRILECPANPAYIGREALIEMSHAKVAVYR